MHKLVLAAALAALIGSCSRPDPNADAFAMLNGTWVMPGDSADYVEAWRRKGEQWDGYAWEVSSGDSLIVEEMQIFNREGEGWVVGIRVPGGQSSLTVFFKLTDWSSDQLVFENPSHDFPKRIVYQMRGTDTMLAYVDDGDPEGPKLEFKFRRAGR